MFRKAQASKALSFVLNVEKNLAFSELTMERYYTAFNEIRVHGLKASDPYFDLLELNDDDTRLLENRNALTAYCNYIIETTPIKHQATSYRFRLISSFLQKLDVDYQKRPFQLPSPAWCLPYIDIISFINLPMMKPTEEITMLSSGKTGKVSDFNFTIINEKVTYHSLLELKELYNVTRNSNIQSLLAFRPTAIALHATISQLLTGIQINHDSHFEHLIDEVMKAAQEDIKEAEHFWQLKREQITTAAKQYFDEDNDALDIDAELIKEIKQQIEVITSIFGKHMMDSTQRNSLITLIVDKVYEKSAEAQIDYMIKQHIDELVMAKKMRRMNLPAVNEHVIFITSGGPGSGKSCWVEKNKHEIAANHGGWENFYKGTVDGLRSILLKYAGINRTNIHPELFSLVTYTQANFVIHGKTLNKLNELAAHSKLPNLFIEQCNVGQDKIDLGLKCGIKVMITVISSDVGKCIERAYARGIEEARHVTATGALISHRDTTLNLPKRIKENAHKEVYIQIMDNNGIEYEKAAEINCREMKIIIYDEEKLLTYIRKTAINIHATKPKNIYDEEKLKEATIEHYFQNLEDLYIIEYANQNRLGISLSS